MKTGNTQIISANDLMDGDVVYLDADGGWTRALSNAALITDKERAKTLLAEAKRQPGTVIDPYLLDVIAEPGRTTPMHIRERLRESGPSFRLDLQRAP